MDGIIDISVGLTLVFKFQHDAHFSLQAIKDNFESHGYYADATIGRKSPYTARERRMD